MTVDQSKVLKNLLFRFLGATRYSIRTTVQDHHTFHSGYVLERGGGAWGDGNSLEKNKPFPLELLILFTQVMYWRGVGVHGEMETPWRKVSPFL